MKKILSLGIAALLAIPQIAVAGPYTDDLSKCLIGSSTAIEKKNLVQWMFFAIALNPDVAQFATISAEDRIASDKNTARLFERMLTEACLSETKLAMRYEGENALGQSFKLLGEVAAGEMFNNQAVSSGVEGFTKHLDADLLSKALGMDPEG